MILDPEMNARTVGEGELCPKRNSKHFLVASGVPRGAKMDKKSMPNRCQNGAENRTRQRKALQPRPRPENPGKSGLKSIAKQTVEQVRRTRDFDDPSYAKL